MSLKKESISPERYYKLHEERSEALIKLEQINALACALSSMVTYETNNKWEILVNMIKELSQ